MVILVSFPQLGLSPLLFCEDAAAEKEKESNVPASAESPQPPPKEMDGSCKPRLCTLLKGPVGFGFNLGRVPQSPGTFITQVTYQFAHIQKTQRKVCTSYTHFIHNSFVKYCGICFFFFLPRR